jgi:hypothetical protein
MGAKLISTRSVGSTGRESVNTLATNIHPSFKVTAHSMSKVNIREVSFQ